MTKRWKLGLATIGLIFLLFPITLHLVAKARLNATRNELRNHGEKLDITELAPAPLSNAIANGQILLRAIDAVGSTLREFAPSPQHLIKPGKARVAWQQKEIIQEIGQSHVPPIHTTPIYTNIWPLFEREFQTNKSALDALRNAVKDPLQFPIDYSKTYSVSVPHLVRGKILAQNLSAAVLANLHQNNVHDATEHLVALVHFVKAWKDEPLLISQLVRGACLVTASATTWEILQSHALSDADLARLQQAWEQIDMLQPGIEAIAVERGNFEPAFEYMRQNPDTFISRERDSVGLFNRYPRYWFWRAIQSYNDERICLQGTTTVKKQFEDVRLGKSGWPPEPDDSEGIIDFDYSFFTPPKREIAGFARASWKFTQEQTLVSLTITAIALERFHAHADHYPDQLTELVPSTLKTVPTDYADAKTVRYKLNHDGSFTLYSVGQNQTDDGGNATQTQFENPTLFHGLDLVWPSAATAEEIRASETKPASTDLRSPLPTNPPSTSMPK